MEVLEAKGISQSELSERTGRPKKTINEIVNGKAAITPETARQLEFVLGIPASFWNSLEQNYRAALARIADRERLARDVDWLKDVPGRALAKRGFVDLKPSKIDQVEALLSFFGVASVDAWRNLWSGFETQAAFRKSAAYETKLGAVAAWLRIGEIKASTINCPPYDQNLFKSALREARALTREDPEVFCEALMRSCASAGVVVLFTRELPGLRVSGATRWLSSTKALIQLTLRYRTNDQLWFTFFHEAGHILLHGKRSVFIDEMGTEADAQDDLGVATGKPEEEAEADRFAADFLIPSDLYAKFLEKQDLSGRAITAFANEIGIDPGIIVGRLQKEKRFPGGYRTALVSLKKTYRWADE
ncbi:MAG TPA: helix-turn-helix domain-containing protein [Longimicrobium sp.]|uniref:helix-turn-helix domain-containing protein n=1 Tax=Longimicrobium sp. TaxID=2029185 RepID=UPI002ED8079B